MSEETKTPENLPAIDTAIANLKEHLQSTQRRIDWLVKHREKFVSLTVAPSFCGDDKVDFDNLPHKDTLTVIRALGGKWKKEPAGPDSLHYQRGDEIDGMKIRCWQSKPPPSCKIVEVDEHVPAVTIPAHTKKVRKLICHPDPGAVIATAAENHLATDPGQSETAATVPDSPVPAA